VYYLYHLFVAYFKLLQFLGITINLASSHSFPLFRYHRLGVRYLTLTHNGGPVWADPALDYDGSWVSDDKCKVSQSACLFEGLGVFFFVFLHLS